MYDLTVQELDTPRNEITAQETIQKAKNLYGSADQLMESVHRYPIVQSQRLRFAVKMFLLKAVWYFIFLSLLTGGTFMNTSYTDNNTYYFVQTVKQTIDSDGQFDSINSASKIYMV